MSSVDRLGPNSVRPTALPPLPLHLKARSTLADEITFPPFYTNTLAWVGGVNVPINFLPFGCIVPGLDNFIFDFVVTTATPLGFVLLMVVLSSWLHKRYGSEGGESNIKVFLADICSDLWCTWSKI